MHWFGRVQSAKFSIARFGIDRASRDVVCTLTNCTIWCTWRWIRFPDYQCQDGRLRYNLYTKICTIPSYSYCASWDLYFQFCTMTTGPAPECEVLISTSESGDLRSLQSRELCWSRSFNWSVIYGYSMIEFESTQVITIRSWTRWSLGGKTWLRCNHVYRRIQIANWNCHWYF